jgi:hypothetical protein
MPRIPVPFRERSLTSQREGTSEGTYEPMTTSMSGKRFRPKYALGQFMSKLPDEKTPNRENDPMFTEPCAGGKIC